MVINKEVNPRFESFLWDWDYEQYILFGGYGSSKSYHIALKIIMKCCEEKRKVLVVREVFDTHRDSTYSLLEEIIEDLELSDVIKCTTSPMRIVFPNGSKIIFKGMDKPGKLKSINGVSIVWLEECSEIKYAGYKELLGRLRTPKLSMHFILSTNPVGTENWVYKHFFKRVDENGREHVTLDDNVVYKKRTVIKNGVYYHHSLPDDNLFLPKSYMKRLDDLKNYDPDLYRIARLGRFGLNGKRVLPQFEVAESHEDILQAIWHSGHKMLRFTGFDFGFEESYNAGIRMVVDDELKYLYIIREYYKNHMTDDRTVDDLKKKGWNKYGLIVADCAEPKAIQYYRQEGIRMRGCKKSAGSRLENTRKMKRFRKIICSPNCTNTIRELSTLTYAVDKKTGEFIYDEFNIDPHTFSAMWYGLDKYTVANIKEQKSNSRRGEAV